MSSSDLSDLSSSPLSEDEVIERIPKGKLEHYFKKGVSVVVPKVKKQRPPSPPHDYVLADNPDIAIICMFRSRFSEAFPKSLPHYGPQDIERGIVDPVPGEYVERLLCALLGLLLNRKKEVEKGHYGRALEEAIHSHANQWPSQWEGKNPLHGDGSFGNMNAEQRLTLLKTLVQWCLEASDAVKNIIKDSYKQTRHEDDLNQPLSVQPWGQDGESRRFWLIEGQDDTNFRLYRESEAARNPTTWFSVAGSIDEVKEVAKHLTDDGSQASRRLADRINAAIPRFEASEEKRKRRDYRIARRAQFSRPEPGFSMYEGRTRGKRIKYTYSDDEENFSDVRRSNRQSGISTPAEPSGPTFTASGRQVKARQGGVYGEVTLAGQNEDAEGAVNGEAGGANHEDEGEDDQPPTRGRPRDAGRSNGGRPRVRKHIDGYNSLDEMDDESSAESSGNEWDGGDDNDEDDDIAADDEDEDEDDAEIAEGDEDKDLMGDEGSDEERSKKSRGLLVSFRYQNLGSSPHPPSETDRNSNPKAPSANDHPPETDKSGNVFASQPQVRIPLSPASNSAKLEQTPSILPPVANHAPVVQDVHMGEADAIKTVDGTSIAPLAQKGDQRPAEVGNGSL